jgi:hypothetical protein
MVLERDISGKDSDYIELVIFFTLVPTFQSFYHTTIFSPQITPTISRNWNVGTSIEMPEKDASTIESITHLRRGVITLGYRVIPLRGKRGAMDNWSSARWRAEQMEGIARNYPDATNTGVLTGDVVAIDVDTPDPAMAEAIKAMVPNADRAPYRIGKAPKLLFIFRATEPRSKRSTGAYMIGGLKCQVEALGVGNQFVAYGIHPDTRQPYTWHNGSPCETALAELPSITPESIDALLARAEAYFAVNGTLLKPARIARDSTPREAGDHPWSQINASALANLDAWVKDIGLEDLRHYASGFHSVASFRPSVNARAKRGRSLSIQPIGIYDHSAGRGMSPIDLVALCLNLSAPDAVEWLRARVGGDVTPSICITGLLSQNNRRLHGKV